MNPCAKNKRRLAWRASGVLHVADAEALRRHLESCSGCRRYWQSISELSERLVNASDLPRAEPTESFHQRVVQKIRAQEQRAPLFTWVITIQRLWRERRPATFSAGVALGIVTLLWIQNFRRDEHPVPSGAQIAVISAPACAVSPPTMASYRRAADISLESLDALLTQEASRKSHTDETLTVSSLLGVVGN
jgi:anti-sigma factor RsiW